MSTTDVGPDAPAKAERGGRLLLLDWFPDDLAVGAIDGSVGPAGAIRIVTDAEGLVSADNGALRLRPLRRPGWGRESLAYGPFARRPGLLILVHALNGHNASQTWYRPETAGQRLIRRLQDARRFRFRRPHHYENFAVGWFSNPSPRSPEGRGNGFVMHSASGDNGELWATSSSTPLRVQQGIQNLEIVYAVALRERGATYYAASVDGANGLGGYPEFRPLAVDRSDDARQVYAGIHQRILGEVGYRVDTRLSWVAVVESPSLSGWFGSAMVADRLTGSEGLAGSEEEMGASWTVEGTAVRTTGGLQCATAEAQALIDAASPCGLLSAIVTVKGPMDRAALLWRGGDAGTWRCSVTTTECQLTVRDEKGAWLEMRRETGISAVPGHHHHLQITDDGLTIGAHLDGRILFGGWLRDERLAASAGVGVCMAGPGSNVRDFEAHPRQVQFLTEVELPGPWTPGRGALVLDERFDSRTEDLDTTTTPSGGRRWERTEGNGSIRLPGPAGARVEASTSCPNPGRTLYTVAWDDPTYAELELTMTPPGTARHQGEEARGGVVFWQDPENYLLANIFLDNDFDGASVSTFYRCRGHEDMYDAVWTLVRSLSFGTPCRLSVACTSSRFLASLNGEPSLHRKFTDVYPDAPPLQIRRVGIVVNREWGDDTGTRFDRFVARASPVPDGRAD